MNRVNLLDNRITLINGDCLEILPKVKPACVDMVFADLPYGTTACEWDSVLPLDQLWKLLNNTLKDISVCTMTCNQPFTSILLMSNIDQYKYAWYWQKSRPTGFTHAKNMPMRVIEDILVFSRASMGHASLLGDRRMTYNPQGLRKVDRVLKQRAETRAPKYTGLRPSHKDVIHQEFTDYPRNLLTIGSVTGAVHPTQKPVELLEYLIKTYTNENDVVLDPTAGSFTTAVACINTNRRCIAIEKDANYFQIGVKRCEDAINARQ